MLGALILAGLGLVSVGSGLQAQENFNKIQNATNTFQDTLKDSYVSNLTVPEIINDLYLGGELNDKEYKRALDTIQTLRDNDQLDSWLNRPSHLLTAGNLGTGLSKKESTELTNLFNLLNDKVPDIKYATDTAMDTLPDKIVNAFKSGVPDISDAPAPNYLDTSFGIYQRDVDPVKLWTGQEMADLHSLNYNPEDYYNLIKQGTSAQVDLGNYKNAQLNNASMVDDTRNVTTYLDNIRANKAQAVVDGITAGQRAANEVLKNTEALTNYATTQADVANQSFENINEALLNDAQANLTARDYFNKLAQSLSTDSSTLYANDTARFGADWAANANFYKADQELRGLRAAANGSMAGAYAQAQAAINGYRGAANRQADEYSWVFNNYLRMNDGDVNRAVTDTNNYIQKQYTGFNTMLDYLNAVNSK